MKILIAGGTGFIGRTIIENLQKEITQRIAGELVTDLEDVL